MQVNTNAHKANNALSIKLYLMDFIKHEVPLNKTASKQK